MKPGVFTQLYVQIVFAVKSRQCLLRNKEYNEIIFSYISGIITSLKNKSIIVNGIEDHIHIFVGLHHTMSISELVSTIKKSSSSFINDKQLFNNKFTWQSGYGAFTYSQSQVEKVYTYIQNQEKHHKKATFKQEYIALLTKFGIEYNDKYLFSFF